ncbi:MAG TPA: hypothetical protein VGS12_03695 [Caulobacteraceae bacterium]|nr:hypothetical protein [Caulobacteraceae bacterium]
MLKVSAAPRPLWLAAASALVISSAASAQIMLRPAPPPRAAAAPPPAPPPARLVAHIPEGTEVIVRTEDRLSSQTSAEGDEFTIATDEPLTLPDGNVIPAGYMGRGEVVAVHKKGMLGKGGDLNVRIDYFRIGDTRVHLRANKGGEGGNTTTTTVVLTVLITPLFLMHHGHEMVFPKGTKIHAYVDNDTDVPLPLPKPPEED